MDSGRTKNLRTDQKRVLLFWVGLVSPMPEHRQCLCEILENAAFHHRCNIKDLAIIGSN